MFLPLACGLKSSTTGIASNNNNNKTIHSFTFDWFRKTGSHSITASGGTFVSLLPPFVSRPVSKAPSAPAFLDGSGEDAGGR